MEYSSFNNKFTIKNNAEPIIGNVRLTSGKCKEIFDNNISFLKKFDFDRMMYWFRVCKGKPATGAPYAFGDGHFENNLYGQTAGMFLMSAATTLMWQEDTELRQTVNKIVDEMDEFIFEDGCLLPIDKKDRFTLEYPNYVRAWLTFGLLAAGYAGNEKAFELARKFGDWFNNSPELPMVKDMNLGFQGILANTELYVSPVGSKEDLDVAQKHYRENWWLELLSKKDHNAISRHPNHPHGTVLTAVEGYLDIYRITGEEYLLQCVKNTLEMIEDKWLHVGGGIVMCEKENDPHYPGCNYLRRINSYNELCCITFWILLNQRMSLLDPDNAHYYDKIEESVYNMLFGAQVGDSGYHYLGWLEGSKDLRYTDITTCCAATGSRLVSMLPQLLYSHTADSLYVNMYADSTIQIDSTDIEVNTDMPYDGKVSIKINSWNKKTLKLRIPSWCKSSVTVCSKTANPGEYLTLENISNGTVFEFELPFGLKYKKYAGADIIPNKERCAFSYGPLMLAALRNKNVSIVCNPEKATLKESKDGRFIIDDNNQIEFMPYMDIKDEPFMVYPIVEKS